MTLLLSDLFLDYRPHCDHHRSSGPQFSCLLSNSLLAQGLTPNEYDCCLFTKMVDNSLMLVLCYVDDSASVHISEKVIEDFYKHCESPAGGNFRFGHLERSISRFLGFDIQRDAKGFILTQTPLIERIYSSAKKHMPRHL